MSAMSSHPLLVVGAGIAGVTSALEAAEAGQEVILIEREASVGGRVLKNHQYFPKMCPPSCGFEINTRRLEKSPNVRVMTNTEVIGGRREGSGWKVTLRHGPQYVNERCTACGDCVSVCPAKIPNPLNLGMDEISAIHQPLPEAWPRRYRLERSACAADCNACAEACKYEAIDLSAKATEETIEFSALIVATGWEPYPLENLRELGGGLFPDVISNVQMERLASESGPTGGKILRPSDGAEPKHIAFVQCAGSRDVNHLPYCSAVCCLASLKQAIYVKEQHPSSEVTVYYIDRRAPGRNEDVLTKVAGLEGVNLVKGKVGKIGEGEGGALNLRVEDVEAGRLMDARADLVILATGMQPSLKRKALPLEIALDEDGFAVEEEGAKVLVAGVARRPEDVASTVRDATGASAKAIMAGRSA